MKTPYVFGVAAVLLIVLTEGYVCKHFDDQATEASMVEINKSVIAESMMLSDNSSAGKFVVVPLNKTVNMFVENENQSSALGNASVNNDHVVFPPKEEEVNITGSNGIFEMLGLKTGDINNEEKVSTFPAQLISQFLGNPKTTKRPVYKSYLHFLQEKKERKRRDLTQVEDTTLSPEFTEDLAVTFTEFTEDHD